MEVGQLRDAKAVELGWEIGQLGDDVTHHQRPTSDVADGDDDPEPDGGDRRGEPARVERGTEDRSDEEADESRRRHEGEQQLRVPEQAEDEETKRLAWIERPA